MIKAITFDFWDTMYHGYVISRETRASIITEELSRAYHTISVDRNDVLALVHALNEEHHVRWKTAQRTSLPIEWLGELAMRLNLQPSSDCLNRIEQRMCDAVSTRGLRRANYLRTTLAKLSADYVLGLLCDTTLTSGSMLRRVLEQDGITGYFKYLAFSDETRFAKPDPRAFFNVLSKLGAQPNESVHVGDLLRSDIQGAKDAGIYAVAYTQFNRDANFDDSTFEIDSFDQLPDVIAAIEGAQSSTHVRRLS